MTAVGVTGGFADAASAGEFCVMGASVAAETDDPVGEVGTGEAGNSVFSFCGATATMAGLLDEGLASMGDCVMVTLAGVAGAVAAGGKDATDAGCVSVRVEGAGDDVSTTAGETAGAPEVATLGVVVGATAKTGVGRVASVALAASVLPLTTAGAVAGVVVGKPTAVGATPTAGDAMTGWTAATAGAADLAGAGFSAGVAAGISLASGSTTGAFGFTSVVLVGAATRFALGGVAGAGVYAHGLGVGGGIAAA